MKMLQIDCFSHEFFVAAVEQLAMDKISFTVDSEEFTIYIVYEDIKYYSILRLGGTMNVDYVITQIEY